jgi:hypothetical protein
MLVMLFLVDDVQQLLTIVGVTFGLVGSVFGLAWYSYRAAQQAAAADEPRPKQPRDSTPSHAARG